MEWALLMATLGFSFLLAPLSFESPVACLHVLPIISLIE
jgi:hypothetical protein